MARDRYRLYALIACVAVAGAGAGYLIGTRGNDAPAAKNSELRAGSIDPQTGKKILYWHDPMVPGHRFDRPGKSPFMDMDLVPVYEGDSNGADGAVTVAPELRQSLGMRTTEVRTGRLESGIEAPGTVTLAEPGLATLQARVGGTVTRLHVASRLASVRKDQPLLDILSPNLIAAQAEFVSLHQQTGADLRALQDAARTRLVVLGMELADIERLRRSGRVQTNVTVRAPRSGVVQEIMVRPGMTVSAGQDLVRIGALDPIWVEVAVPEAQGALLRPGQPATVHAAAQPGQGFSAKVAAVLPEVSPETRTRLVRLQVPNRRQQLVPGMAVRVNFGSASSPDMLLVPEEAIIRTGRRAIVFKALGEGRFQPVEVTPGRSSGGQTEIVSGLKAGDRIVTSGQFLLDSEASLQGTLDRMGGVETTPEGASQETPAAAPQPQAAPVHTGIGTVVAVMPDAIKLTHEPIPALNWPTMTMNFAHPSNLTVTARPGQRVEFTFVMDDKRGAVLMSLKPIDAVSGAASSPAPARATPQHEGHQH